MIAIGIDLGTTNSAGAIGGKEIKVLPTRSGEQLTPSVVSFVKRRKSEDGEIVVGRQAVANAGRDPTNTIFSIKRLMGRVYGEQRVKDVAAHVNYEIAPPPAGEDPDQGVRVMLGGKSYTPVEISAMILQQVRGDAEQALGEPVRHAVITVPAYFEERQRKATAEAGERAGLTVLKIIDEPTAAAIAFGAGKESERHRVLVYDLGGGTFDISIIQMTAGQYQVLVIQGDNWLGGDDFDQTIVKRMIDWVRKTYDFDASSDKVFLAKAKDEAQKAKIALSTQQSVDIFAPLLKLPDQGIVDVDMPLSREEFESDIRPLVERTIELVNMALKDQNFEPEAITEVLLVGGSTAVPLVQQAVCDRFGQGKVKRHVNPMECVALGAAILADGFKLDDDGQHTGAGTGPGVHEVTPMHLGIAAVKGDNPDAFVPIIEKGTPYPLTEPKQRIFYATEDQQTLIKVPVYEGLNQLASLNEQQGIIEFPLPQGIRATDAVEVSFNYDKNRLLTVTVRVVGTDLQIQETLRRDRARVVKPQGEKLTDDWREDLQPSLRSGAHFLETYGEFMAPDDRQELQQAIQLGHQALEAKHEIEGKRVTLILRNKILGSGTASQLFIAERAMQDAAPDVTRKLAEATSLLREAHRRRDSQTVEQVSSTLRLIVAAVMSERQSRREVHDKVDLGNLLRVRE